jgi:oligopeptide transport system substrate-binding protein
MNPAFPPTASIAQCGVSVEGEASVSPEMADKGIQLETAVSTASRYFAFNWLDPVVGGAAGERARKLRQAISIALDWEEFISIFANGRGIAGQGPIPPGIFGFIEGERGVNPVIYDWTPNGPKRKSIEVARKLLAEAGYPNGRDEKTGQPLTLTLDTTERGPDDKSRLDWLRKQFAKLSIQLEIRGSDYNRFQERVRKGAAQMFIWAGTPITRIRKISSFSSSRNRVARSCRARTPPTTRTRNSISSTSACD